MSKTPGPARSPRPAVTRRGASVGSAPAATDFVEQWREERPDLDFDWMAVTVRIHQIEQAFRGDLAKAVIPRVGGGLADFDVISHLRAAGPPYALRPTDLFRMLSVTSGAVTGRIDRLESLGWVTRDPSEADRRTSLVRLTEQGLAVSDFLAEYGARASVIARALLTLSASERRRLVELLERLYQATADAERLTKES